MQPIKITVSSTRAVCSERPDPITTGMVGLRAEFAFSEDWVGLQKTAVCAGSGVTKDVQVVQDAITVPHECLTDPASDLKIGVYGVNSSGDLVIPTVYAYCGRLFRGADPSGDTSTDYTLPIWAQLQAMIGDLSNLTTTARDNLVAAINEAAKSGGGGGGTAADVRMQVAGGYIQYSTDGGTTWRNLIAVAELIGPSGKSAYTYAVEAGYTGTEAAFAERMAAEIPSVDSTLTQSGQAADAAVVGNRLSALSEEIANLQTSGLTTEQVNALDSMFKVCAFIKADISAEYNAFKTAFNIEAATITGISAIYSGGDVAVGTAVTDLTGIVVTANYSDGSKRTVTGYTLSGTIAEGSNTITVTYEGMTTTFTVTGVADEVTMTSISVTYSGGSVPAGTALDDLTGIVVTATYSDGSTSTVTGYTLSGEIVEGDNTISVTYNGKTATFTVTGTVEHGRVEHIVSGQTFPVTLTWSPVAFDVTPALATYVSSESTTTYYDVEIDVESISSKNAYITVTAGGGAFTRNASDYAGQTGTLKMTGEIWHPSMSDASQIKIACNKGTETSVQTAVITGVRIYER